MTKIATTKAVYSSEQSKSKKIKLAEDVVFTPDSKNIKKSDVTFNKIVSEAVNPTIKGFKEYQIGSTIDKIKNQEYVSPQSIDAVASLLKKNSEGSAAKRNPTYFEANGFELAKTISSAKDYYSAFQNEDEYNTYKYSREKQGEYSDYSFDELRDKISELEKKKQNSKNTDEISAIQREKDWLVNYSITRKYNTSKDYDYAIANLQSQIEDLKEEYGGVFKSGKGLVGGSGPNQHKIDELERQIDVLKIGKSQLERENELYDKYYYLTETEDYERTLSNYQKFKESAANDAKRNLPKGTNLQKNPEVTPYYFGSDLVIPEEMKDLWLQTNDKEKKMATYIALKKGNKAALEYLKDIEIELSERNEEFWMNQAILDYENSGAWGKIQMNLASIPASVFGNIISGTSDIVSLMKTGTINPYSSDHSLQNYASVIRQATSDDIDEAIENEFLSKLATYSYQGVMSSADMVVGSFFLGPEGYTLSMGLGAFSSQARNLYERGESKETVILGASLSALLEMGTEAIGADRFFKTLFSKNGKTFLKNFLIQLGAEPSEELISKFGNRMIDSVLTGENSERENKIREYINQGLTRDEAKRKAESEFVKEAAWEAFSALISVGSSSFVSAANYGLYKAEKQRIINISANKIVNKGNVDALLKIAENISDNSTVKLNKEIESFSESDKSNVKKTARLYSQTIDAITNKIAFKTTTAIQQELQARGFEGDIVKTANTIFEMAHMGEVEKSDIRKIEKDGIASEIYKELSMDDSSGFEWVTQLSSAISELSQMRNLVAVLGEISNKQFNEIYVEFQRNNVEISTKHTLNAGEDSGIINSNQHVGDEANVGQQDGNDNQRLGGTIHTSESQVGTVQENLGRNYDQSRTKGIQQRRSSEVRNQGNNRRIEPTVEQKEGLKTTAIKDENGNPKVVAHFTDNMDFETFEKGDIGFHFGNEQQAVERGRILKKQGRIIKAHLDIKNPLKISTDLMTWSPINIAFKLSVEEVITKEDFTKIRELTEQGGSNYNSPAAVELRKILADLGYDGIAYENMFEADGESYIAFYPEQVIIIDDGKSQAGTNADGEIGLTNPEDREIWRKPTAQEEDEALFGRRKDAKQRHIIDVAKKLDNSMTVVFVDPNSRILSGEKGVYEHKTNTIYISTDNTVVGMYCQLFKHEFVHRLESKKAYQGFKNYLFNHSTAFERYVRAELKRINGIEFEGTREEAIRALSDRYIERVKKGGFKEEYKRNFSLEYAEREVVANFVGKVLFKGKENRADVAQSLADGEIEAITSLEDTFAEFENLNETERSWFRRMIDTIKDWIASLKGVKQNERLVNDLEYIEQRLSRVLDSKDTKKAASRAVDRQFYFNDDNTSESKFIIDTINENVGSISKENIFSVKGEEIPEGTKKTEYVLNIFNEQGNVANNSEIGLVELVQSGAKSTVFHGFGAEKLAATKAIKSVIEQGVIIKTTKNYNNTGVDRYVMAAKGNIDGKPAFVGLIIKAYPNQKNQKAKFYLHEATIIETDSPIMTAPQLSVDTVSESVYKNSVPHEEDTVKNNISEESQDYSQNDGEIKQSFALDISTKQENEEKNLSSGSPMQQMRDNLKRYESGEITREEYLEENDRLWGEANKTYDSIPQGENANAPIATPRAVADDKLTKRFTRTIIETGKLTDEMLEGVEEKVLLGDFSYKIMSDKAALEKADKTIEYGTAERIWSDTVNSAKRINKNQIAIGERLLAEAINKKDTKRVLELSGELADVFTRAGQVVQAASLLKKMTGAGRLVSAQRMVETLNSDLRTKYGDDFEPIKISAEAAARLADAKTKNGIEHAYEEIMYEIAKQMPVTFMDKWNAWRYFAMLSNPKTHIRNIVGNAIFVPVVRIKKVLAASMELAVDKSERTKSLVIKKEYADFAKRDSGRDEVKQLLKGNKYNDKTALKEKQQIFKTKALEFITTFNSNALEAEDMLFKNKHYINALAGFLQARKVNLETVSEDVLNEARIYAVNEAKKATFNDESALADAVQRLANKNIMASVEIEGILPFKRTPINVVKRGVEYSPLGLAKTLTKGVYDVKKGKITATEFIDGLASGLTGTGIMLVGMFLANLGCVSGGEDDEDESVFEKLLGKQEYAVEFLGKSYTIDWAAPACIPFFIGVEIMNTIKEGEAIQLSDIGNIVWNSLEPITNLSMLSGIQGVIESARYANSSQILSAIIGDALTSYVTQGLPSASGALSRTIDPTQRSWYIDKNSKLFDSFTQSIINNIQSKVPGLSYTQVPKIDMWGREVSRGNIGERVMENFVSPGYYSEIEYNDTSEELKRIFKKTDIDVFPNLAKKSFKLNGETKYLTANEYVTYAKSKGEYSFDYLNEFMNNSAYKKLTDEERAVVIKGLYEYSNAKAKTTVSDYDLMNSYKTVTNWERYGRSAVDYYVYKAISK